MIHYLRIRYKFFLMAALGVIAIILMSLLAQTILQDGFQRVEAVFADSKKLQHIQRDFIAPLFRIREITLALVTAPNNDYRAEIKKDLDPLINSLNASFHSLDNPNLNLIWENYKVLMSITDEYIRNGFEEGAFTNVNNIERKQFYILISELETIQEIQLQNSQTTFQKAHDNFYSKRLLILAGAILVVILTLLFGFLIARNIVFSTDRLQHGLDQFFALLGRKLDKDTKITIDLPGRDEFGEMARKININIENVRENLKKDLSLIECATALLHDIQQGKLTGRLTESTSSEELNRLQSVMNAMLENLNQRIILEINERTKQEQLLIQQSKLAAMGNMIGNIAHQWRQPLSEVNAILMSIQAQKENNDLSDVEFFTSLEKCDAILAHMSGTISDFQNFFRPSKEKELFNIADACQKACSILQASLKYHHIALLVEHTGNSNVMGYPNEFSQAILNILSNAKDVLIDRNIQNPFIKMNIFDGKSYTIIKIEDNGQGISEKNIERIFEPYFTTKHAKQGTGIGLYMTKMIIENNMNGFINVGNTDDGALFTIKIKHL